MVAAQGVWSGWLRDAGGHVEFGCCGILSDGRCVESRSERKEQRGGADPQFLPGRFPYKQTEPRKLAIEASTTKLYFPKTWDSISQKGSHPLLPLFPFFMLILDLFIAKDFIQRLLTVDPALRMTAAEALQHPVQSLSLLALVRRSFC